VSDVIADELPSKPTDIKEITARYTQVLAAQSISNESMERAKAAALKANTDLWVVETLTEAFIKDYPQYAPEIKP
jgi:hypothetical protein